MDSPNRRSPKIIPKPAGVKMGTPFEDIERASVKSKITEALGRYEGYTPDASKGLADNMVSVEATLYLHPSTIAGAIVLIAWALGHRINYPNIFMPKLHDPVDSISEIVRKNKLTLTRTELVNLVMDKIIPSNMSGPKLDRIRLRTQADLMRYMQFIEKKVNFLFERLKLMS